MSDETFTAVVIGAGPAGIAAAYRMAELGMDVVVLERGKFPGAKNVIGGVLYTPILGELIPDFWESAPLERRVVQRRFSFLDSGGEVACDFQTAAYDAPPFNHSFTALRAKFDTWFADRAEEMGAFVISGTVVDDFLYEGESIVGVKTRTGEEIRSRVVICADGANSLLAEKAGLRSRPDPEHMVVGIKEVIALPRKVIEERFHLEGDQGVAIEYFGDAVQGLYGSGFLYTNRESLSLGIGVTLADLKESRTKSFELFEHFKRHPVIRPLIRDGETVEYLGHMIPEGGYNEVPNMVRAGLILAGDAAGLVNTSFYHEGSNLAMASGLAAAETVRHAAERDDFSAATLSEYTRRLEESFVIQDLKKYRGLPNWALAHPEFFNRYPQAIVRLATDFFRIDGRSKSVIQREALRRFREDVGTWRFVRDLISLGRTML